MKSGSTGINENIIFEGVMDSTEFLIDFFFSLSNDLYYMHNRAAHYYQGISGWLLTGLLTYLKKILEVWAELPVGK